MEKIRRLFWNKEFLGFLAIGGINTLGGTLYAYLLSLFLQENIAFIVGYIISLFIAYLLNIVFVFKEKLSLIKLIKFCISYIPNFILQNLIVLVVYNIMGWHRLLAYAMAAIIGIPITFLFVKFFAFGRNNRKA